MIKTIFLLLPLSICCIKSRSQSIKNNLGRISYIATVRTSSFIPGTTNKIDTTDLYFNDTGSVYSVRQKYLPVDKILQSIENIQSSKKQQIIESIKVGMAKNKQHFSYHKAGTAIFFSPWEDADKKSYCIFDTIPDYNWSLLSDTIRILGLLCQKAICSTKVMGSGIEREFTAWYSPEIAVTYGPYKFFGLPGLILEIENKYYSYKATAIKFPISITETTININCCQGLPIVSRKTVQELNNKQKNDLMNMLKLQND